MENKWRKITLVFFFHVLKKPPNYEFQEELAQRKQTYCLYIHVEMHA